MYLRSQWCSSVKSLSRGNGEKAVDITFEEYRLRMFARAIEHEVSAQTHARVALKNLDEIEMRKQ